MKLISYKKIILCIALLLCIFASSGHLVLAQQGGDSAVRVTGENKTSTFTLKNPLQNVNSVGALVNKFIEIISYLLIIFAVLMIVWTGLQFILARGNPEKMKEEGKRLGYILIGVALVIGARILVTVIINTLQATGTVSPQVINQAHNAADNR
jgi:hypothetical protein